MGDLRERALRWLEMDPDPETRAATQALLDADDRDGLEACFSSRLEFGTAGMRGPLGPGPNRMNRAQVRQVSAGLAAWVAARAPGDGPVVVGFDGRHGSEVFADDAARVIAGAGLPVVRFPTLGPTPLLAFAVLHLGARAGVMVTASHNPPADNGYKVYWSDGAQIIPPHDRGISHAIGDAAPALAPPEAVASVGPEVVERYVAAVLRLRVHAPDASLRIAYTPLHGVGRDLLVRVLAEAGHTDVHVVPEQAEPDGDFPTVRFPNPEEPGALDLVLGLADGVGADLVIANDPDADRIAVAVPCPEGWRVLTGNEVGCLLAEDVLAHGARGEERLVANTIVSSQLLGAIAAHHGVRCVQTLTGFKWISRAADRYAGRLVLGYEEALGVCVGSVVRDKDGISAALLICDLAARMRDRGQTLTDALDALYRRHGVHASTQRSIALPGAEGSERIRQGMATLRGAPPVTLGGEEVLEVLDGLVATDDRPPSDLLGYTTRSARILVRPSGTEPKVKVYVEVIEPPDPDVAAATARATARASALADAFVGASPFRG